MLSLESFLKFGNVCKASEKALFSIVPQIAVEKKIPLIFWGENPATQVGDSAVLGENSFDGNKLRNLNTLRDGGDDWIYKVTNDRKALFYSYPDIQDMDNVGVSITT